MSKKLEKIEIDFSNVELSSVDKEVNGDIITYVKVEDKRFFENNMPSGITIEEHNASMNYSQNYTNAVLNATATLAGKKMKEDEKVSEVILTTGWGSSGKYIVSAKRDVEKRNPSTGVKYNAPSLTGVIKTSKLKSTPKAKKEALEILNSYLDETE